MVTTDRMPPWKGWTRYAAWSWVDESPCPAAEKSPPGEQRGHKTEIPRGGILSLTTRHFLLNVALIVWLLFTPENV
jgi:hypothetical protein